MGRPGGRFELEILKYTEGESALEVTVTCIFFLTKLHLRAAIIDLT